MENYAFQNFNPELYLKARFGSDVNDKERILFPLEKFHEEFSVLPESLKILDYGTGPVMMSVISAAIHASEIILCEYNPKNREALRAWLDNEPSAFNWSPFFDHVVQKLEGKSLDEARERETLVRKVVKNDVISCNIYSPSIIEEGYEGPYDVVSSSCCLESSCTSRETFRHHVAKLAALVKSGGRMMLYLTERNMERENGVYLTGSTEHGIVNVSADYVADLLSSIGFSDVKKSSCRGDPAVMRTYQDDDILGFLFVSGTKM